MGPEKAQLVSVVERSESIEEDLTPRFTIETVEEGDGPLLKITFQPRRYFYGAESLKHLSCRFRLGSVVQD